MTDSSTAAAVAPSYKRLEGKVAIITGGASGVGANAVKLFWENGAKVVIADIQDELGQGIADKLGKNGCYVHCDVSNEEDVINLVNTAIAKYGQLDIMYNNAGVINRSFGSILDITKSDFQLVLNVNLVGSFLGAKHAARVMIPNRTGCILFTASNCASIAGVASHSYAASKHGVVGLMKNLSSELGQYGIRVNCVSPFGFASGISGGVPAKFVEGLVQNIANLKGPTLRAMDVAKGALYLASNDASCVSGLNLVMDGGYSVVNPSMMNLSR